MKPAINRALETIGLNKEAILACQKYPTLATATGFVEPEDLLKLIVALNIEFGAEARAMLLVKLDELLDTKYPDIRPNIPSSVIESFRMFATERSGKQIEERMFRARQDVDNTYLRSQPNEATRQMLRGYRSLMRSNSGSVRIEARYVEMLLRYIAQAITSKGAGPRYQYKAIYVEITREMRKFIPYARIDTIVLNRAAAIEREKSERSRKRSR